MPPSAAATGPVQTVSTQSAEAATPAPRAGIPARLNPAVYQKGPVRDSSRGRAAPWCRPEADDDAVAERIRLQGTGGALWRVAGVKLFMDGTIDNGTAWLEAPDRHGESAHAHWPDPQRSTQAVAALHRAGVPTATHAIGDTAVRHVLDALEKAQAQGPGAVRPVRHRVEHVETVPDDTVRWFAPLAVAASMPPAHCGGSARSVPGGRAAAVTCGRGRGSSSAPTGPSRRAHR